jgi:hypothetical protein
MLLIEDYTSLKYVKKNEGMFTTAYFGDKGSALRYRVKKYPDINNGDIVYEMHIDIHPDEQGKGLAVDMIKSFLYRNGGVAWLSRGRVLNSNVYKVVDKIRKDRKFLVTDYDDGITIEEK